MHCIKGIFVVCVWERSCNGCRGDDACACIDVSGQWTVTELMPPRRRPNRQVQLPIQQDAPAQPEPVVPRRKQNRQQFPIHPNTPAPAQPDPPALTLPELVPLRRRASRRQQQPVQLIPPIQTDTHVQPDAPAHPDTPDLPDAPAHPDTPDLPDAPAHPDTLVRPDYPDSPVQPAPTHPATPDQPDAPVQVEPAHPDASVLPAHPDTPDQPDAPVHPDPAHIDTPDHPDAHVQPAHPDTPDQPDTPVHPDHPDAPVQPDPAQRPSRAGLSPPSCNDEWSPAAFKSAQKANTKSLGFCTCQRPPSQWTDVEGTGFHWNGRSCRWWGWHNVRFMKTGGHYLWPNIGDLSFVFVHEIVEILPAPHIDGRGKHFF